MFDDEELSSDPEQELITISLEDYEKLVQLIPVVERQKHIIGQLDDVIRDKNEKLKVLQRTLQRKERFMLGVSKLSNVNSFHSIILRLFKKHLQQFV